MFIENCEIVVLQPIKESDKEGAENSHLAIELRYSVKKIPAEKKVLVVYKYFVVHLNEPNFKVFIREDRITIDSTHDNNLMPNYGTLFDMAGDMIKFVKNWVAK